MAEPGRTAAWCRHRLLETVAGVAALMPAGAGAEPMLANAAALVTSAGPPQLLTAAFASGATLFAILSAAQLLRVSRRAGRDRALARAQIATLRAESRPHPHPAPARPPGPGGVGRRGARDQRRDRRGRRRPAAPRAGVRHLARPSSAPASLRPRSTVCARAARPSPWRSPPANAATSRPTGAPSAGAPCCGCARPPARAARPSTSPSACAGPSATPPSCAPWSRACRFRCGCATPPAG